MFEQLFGSKTRVKLIRIFLDNPDQYFYVRELTRISDSLINSVRRELDNLIDLNFVMAVESENKKSDQELQEKAKKFNTKKFYKLNPNNLFHQDLRGLFSKGKLLLEKKFVERIKKLGDIKYVSLGGIFIDDEKAVSDLLVIGNLDKARANSAMQKFEKELGKTIRYTILDLEEYHLRRDIADRFLLDIMNNEENVVFVDDLAGYYTGQEVANPVPDSTRASQRESEQGEINQQTR